MDKKLGETTNWSRGTNSRLPFDENVKPLF